MSKMQIKVDEFESSDRSRDKIREAALDLIDLYFDEGEVIDFGEIIECELDILNDADRGEEELEEDYRRRVTSTGKVSRVRSRQARQRRATMTTGRSPSARKRSARKAARTKKRNPSIQRKALRKRRKAIRRRRQMGLK